MTSSWHTLGRNSRTRRNAKALEQLSATLQQWTETLSARIESVDLTAAQHRATQTQLIANVKSSLDNLPAPKAAPPKPLAGAELSTEPPTGEPASGAEVHALRATFESWHTTTWTRIENLTLRLDEMEARQAKTSDVTTQQMAELTAEIRAVVGSLNEQQPE